MFHISSKVKPADIIGFSVFQSRLIGAAGLQAIGPVARPLEHVADLRMPAGLAALIGQQILLRHIGDIGRLRVLGEEVIEGLVAMRADLRRDRLQPFFGIAENGIDIEHHTAERINAMLHNFADPVAGGTLCHDDKVAAGGRYVKLVACPDFAEDAPLLEERKWDDEPAKQIHRHRRLYHHA